METYPWLCLGGAMVLAMIYCAFLAMAVEKVAYKPLRGSSRLAALVSRDSMIGTGVAQAPEAMA